MLFFLGHWQKGLEMLFKSLTSIISNQVIFNYNIANDCMKIPKSIFFYHETMLQVCTLLMGSISFHKDDQIIDIKSDSHIFLKNQGRDH